MTISVFWRLLPLIIVLGGLSSAIFFKLELFDKEVLRALPYIVASLLAAFAVVFNRSRFIAPILITVFTYFFIRTQLQSPLIADSSMTKFIGLNLLFCLQLSLTALWPEKGLTSRAGAFFLAVLVAGSLALWFRGTYAPWMDFLLENPLHHANLSEDRYWVSQLLALSHGATLAIVLVMAFLRRTAADYALFLTWLVGATVFFDFATPDVSAIGMSALMLALFVIFQQSNYHVTFIDSLTGIPGRRALEDYLPTLGKHYCIAMLDVDHFKKFNDIFGHDTGDQVLQLVASKINQVAGGGKAFRYGGEEFTIVFNRQHADEAFVYLEAVRTAIQEYKMAIRSQQRPPNKKEGQKQRGQKKTEGKTVSVTISIGVANSASGMKAKDVIKLADQELYRAKKQGRNQTCKQLSA